jgi:hypothetical protein
MKDVVMECRQSSLAMELVRHDHEAFPARAADSATGAHLPGEKENRADFSVGLERPEQVFTRRFGRQIPDVKVHPMLPEELDAL